MARLPRSAPPRELRQQLSHAQFLDARGRVIMPGLINTHMHLYSTFARGMALKDAPPGNFFRFWSASGGGSTRSSPWTMCI